jgi:hypothetical protein
VRAVSVDNLSVLPDGEIGLVQIFDLANVSTVLAVQSDDLGYTKFDGGGVEMAGRAMVESGRVIAMPDEPPAGVGGDAPIFRLLENYINFSIDFGMLGTRARKGSEGSGSAPDGAARPRVSKTLDADFEQFAASELERVGGEGAQAETAGDAIENMVADGAAAAEADYSDESVPAPTDFIEPSYWEEVENANEGAAPSCPQVVDELIMSEFEPEAKAMAEEATHVFEEQADRPLSHYQKEWERDVERVAKATGHDAIKAAEEAERTSRETEES